MTTFYSGTIERLLGEAQALVNQGQLAEAELRVREVLGHQPRNARGHALLGMSLLGQNRLAEALAHIEDALRSDRVNPRFHYLHGLCLTQLGRLEDATASYRRALQFRPQFVEARANLGYLFERLGRADEAIACYRQVLGYQPQEWFSLNRLAYCERVQGGAQVAAELLQRALSLRPDHAASYNELALALLDLGRKPEAVPLLRRAVELQPEFLEAWRNLAKLLYVDHLDDLERSTTRDEPSELLRCFDTILKLDPENVEVSYLRDCVRGIRHDRPPDGYIRLFFDRFAPQFEARLVKELDYAAPRVAAGMLADWLATRSGLRVVDLGCGSGLSGEIVRPAASRLTGVDLSAGMLERARARHIYDELIHAEIGDYLAQVTPGSFDLAVALDVFIYVGDLDRILGACAAALAPGGLLMLSVEAAQEGDFVLSAAGRYAHSRQYVHQAGERAGFRLAECREFVIRKEAGRDVNALMFALEKA